MAGPGLLPRKNRVICSLDGGKQARGGGGLGATLQGTTGAASVTWLCSN